MDEVFLGVEKWLVVQMVSKMGNTSLQQRRVMINKTKINFKKIKDAADCPRSNEPLTYKDLEDPYSSATCVILYLYSMELGSPPLYAELNRVARDMDTTQLEYLGPIQRAVFMITLYAEEGRTAEDKIKTGE